MHNNQDLVDLLSTATKAPHEIAPLDYIPFKQFVGPVRVKSLDLATDTKKLWVVEEPFKYHTGVISNKSWVYVPKDFITDLASIPRPFWAILPPWGEYSAAAIVHDYLCRNKQVYRYNIPVTITQSEVDKIFLEAMGVLNVPAWKKYIIYSAVRLYSYCKFDFS